MPLDDTNWPATAEVDEPTALLIRARGFMERGWCKGRQAVDESGKWVESTSKQAVAWCAYGALVAAGLVPGHPALTRLFDAMGGVGVIPFNDRQETVEPVLAAFDRALADQGCGR
jgi:hypothetical protein